MKNIVELTLVGRVGKIIVSDAVARVSIASNNRRKDKNKAWIEDPHWSQINAFHDRSRRSIAANVAQGDLGQARGRVRQGHRAEHRRTTNVRFPANGRRLLVARISPERLTARSGLSFNVPMGDLVSSGSWADPERHSCEVTDGFHILEVWIGFVFDPRSAPNNDPTSVQITFCKDYQKADVGGVSLRGRLGVNTWRRSTPRWSRRPRPRRSRPIARGRSGARGPPARRRLRADGGRGGRPSPAARSSAG